MSVVKTLALASVLIFGTSQLALAQGDDSHAAGGGADTASGHPAKAQNNDRGPGNNPDGPGQSYQ